MRLSKEVLEQEYLINNKAISQIANEFGYASKTTICRLLRKYNIKLRKHTKSVKCIESAKKQRTGFKGITGSYFCSLRNHARLRNRELSITKEYIWWLYKKQKGRCALSGKKIFFPKNKQIRTEQTASLDRIDSSKGYIVGNVQWLHKDINYMKQDMTDQEFIKICKLVSRKHT